MKSNKVPLKMLIALLLIVIIPACEPATKQKEQPTVTRELHIATAAGLRFAFEEIGEVFEVEKGTRVVFQFGSSGNLAQQISSGAPVDLFISANKSFVEDLVAKGDILDETVELFAIGRIVLAVNKQSGLEVHSLNDLSCDEIDYISIANSSHAPYGMAAKEALENKGLWDQLEDKLIYGETVTQAMQFVRTGNAPVGIIALSIAGVPEIESFPVDEMLYNPLEQMLGVVSHSQQKELALEFAAFVNGPRGQAIMKKHGFDMPE